LEIKHNPEVEKAVVKAVGRAEVVLVSDLDRTEME
jgi:phosphatidate phosphatase APP1